MILLVVCSCWSLLIFRFYQKDLFLLIIKLKNFYIYLNSLAFLDIYTVKEQFNFLCKLLQHDFIVTKFVQLFSVNNSTTYSTDLFESFNNMNSCIYLKREYGLFIFSTLSFGVLYCLKRAGLLWYIQWKKVSFLYSRENFVENFFFVVYFKYTLFGEPAFVRIVSARKSLLLRNTKFRNIAYTLGMRVLQSQKIYIFQTRYGVLSNVELFKIAEGGRLLCIV